MEEVMSFKPRSQPLFSFPRLSARVTLLALVALSALLLCSGAFAQTTVSNGSINGTVSDPTGAVVNGARVIITNTGTGHSLNLTENSSGAYPSGPLAPGAY